MKVEQFRTLTLFGGERLKDKNGEMNVMVGGASRGGTSSVGAIMKALGFPMGDRLHPTTHEDIDFSDLVNYGSENTEWLALIRDRRDRIPGWSTKLPNLFRKLPLFESELDRPLYVIVVRNPFSVARTLVNRDEEYGDSMLEYMRGYSHAVEHYADCFREIGMVRGAFAVCEYERLLDDPADFITTFARICQRPVSPRQATQVATSIAKGDYRAVDRIYQL